LFGLDSRAVPIRPNGSFVVAALQPGSYHLHFRESTWPPPGEIPRVSIAKVVVADADVPNVRVAPVHMVRATGRVVVDAASRQALQPSLIQIGASPIDFDGNPGPSQSGTVREDLTFEFMMWPAAGTIRGGCRRRPGRSRRFASTASTSPTNPSTLSQARTSAVSRLN
jgi:hypothetical protein